MKNLRIYFGIFLFFSMCAIHGNAYKTATSETRAHRAVEEICRAMQKQGSKHDQAVLTSDHKVAVLSAYDQIEATVHDAVVAQHADKDHDYEFLQATHGLIPGLKNAMSASLYVNLILFRLQDKSAREMVKYLLSCPVPSFNNKKDYLFVYATSEQRNMLTQKLIHECRTQAEAKVVKEAIAARVCYKN